MFNIYIRRAAELYGVTHTRPIYEVRWNGVLIVGGEFLLYFVVLLSKPSLH